MAESNYSISMDRDTLKHEYDKRNNYPNGTYQLSEIEAQNDRECSICGLYDLCRCSMKNFDYEFKNSPYSGILDIAKDVTLKVSVQKHIKKKKNRQTHEDISKNDVSSNLLNVRERIKEITGHIINKTTPSGNTPKHQVKDEKWTSTFCRSDSLSQKNISYKRTSNFMNGSSDFAMSPHKQKTYKKENSPVTYSEHDSKTVNSLDTTLKNDLNSTSSSEKDEMDLNEKIRKMKLKKNQCHGSKDVNDVTLSYHLNKCNLSQFEKDIKSQIDACSNTESQCSSLMAHVCSSNCDHNLSTDNECRDLYLCNKSIKERNHKQLNSQKYHCSKNKSKYLLPNVTTDSLLCPADIESSPFSDETDFVADSDADIYLRRKLCYNQLLNRIKRNQKYKKSVTNEYPLTSFNIQPLNSSNESSWDGSLCCICNSCNCNCTSMLEMNLLFDRELDEIEDDIEDDTELEEFNHLSSNFDFLSESEPEETYEDRTPPQIAIKSNVCEETYGGVHDSDEGNDDAHDSDGADLDADDEFECDCHLCQELLSGRTELTEPTLFEESQIISVDQADFQTDIGPSDLQNYAINMAELESLDALTMRSNRGEMIDLFQNVIRQIFENYPELLHEQPAPPASFDVIANVPIITIEESTFDSESRCPICLSNFELKEEGRVLPCHHIFHTFCIQAWLSKSGTCPVCRQKLEKCDG